MKKFGAPKISVVRLSNENIITASGCETNMCLENVCMGYDCPDCPTECDGIYHCEVFKCGPYDQ